MDAATPDLFLPRVFNGGVGDAQHPEPQDDPLQAGVQAAEHGSPYRGPVLDPRSLDGALHIEPN
jgi:hypothetical protein